MNRSIFSIIFLGGIFFFTSLNYGEDIKNYILSITNRVKLLYLESYEGVENFFATTIDQKELIEKLQRENEENKRLALLAIGYANELNNLIANYKSIKAFEPNLYLVKVISYAKFGDLYKFWLDFKNFNDNKIYGLIQNGFVAGIVINKNSKPLALLNGDEKCTYAVSIGANNAPGIIKGLSSKNRIIADFIPSWVDIEIGDEVVTSGLDNIFFNGIKVGVVTKIEYSQGYKVATIKPYANILNPSYFYVIDLNQ